MAGFGVDTEVESSDGLKLESEEEKEIQGFSLEPVDDV